MLQARVIMLQALPTMLQALPTMLEGFRAVREAFKTLREGFVTLLESLRATNNHACQSKIEWFNLAERVCYKVLDKPNLKIALPPCKVLLTNSL